MNSAQGLKKPRGSMLKRMIALSLRTLVVGSAL